MDSFTQAAAYLQPTLEYAAKLGSIIPLWMLLVMADKHLLGLPMLEGSFWHSPRIPPRFTLKARHGGENVSHLNASGQSADSGGDLVYEEAAPFEPSPLQSGFTESSTPCAQATQAASLVPESLSLQASGTTALSIYQPLEVHDPFSSSCTISTADYVGGAVILVLVIAFLGIIVKCGWFSKNQTPQSQTTSDTKTSVPDTLTGPELIEKLALPVCWDFDIGEVGRTWPDLPLQDYFTEQTNIDIAWIIKQDSEMKAEKAEMVEKDLDEKTDSDTEKAKQSSKTNAEDESSNPNPPLTIEDSVISTPTPPPQKLSLSTITYVQTSPLVLAPPNSSPTCVSEKIGDHEGGHEEPEKKKKKHKMRQNAKKRAANRAAREEARQEGEEAAKDFQEDTKGCEEEEGNPEEAIDAGEAPTGADEASEVKAKKKRRRQKRHHEVKIHSPNDVDYKPDLPAVNSPPGMATKKMEKNEKDQAQPLPSADGQIEASFVLEGEDNETVIRPPVEHALGRAQIKDRNSPDAPMRRRHHTINVEHFQHDNTEGGADYHYQRLKRLLEDYRVSHEELQSSVGKHHQCSRYRQTFCECLLVECRRHQA